MLTYMSGNAVYSHVAAVLNRDGVPWHVATAYLGLKIVIDSVAVADRTITIQSRQHGPNDPTCCPSQEVASSLRLTKMGLELISEVPAGQLSHALTAIASTPTPTPPVQQSSLTCLTHAEISYLNAINQMFEESTRSARYRMIDAEVDALGEWFDWVDYGSNRADLYRAIARGLETLRLLGLEVHGAIASLPDPPTTRTAQLDANILNYYQTIVAAYNLLAAYINDQPAVSYRTMQDSYRSVFGAYNLGFVEYYNSVFVGPRRC